MSTPDVAGRRTATKTTSSRLKTARVVLVIGLVLAVAACFGTAWVVRVGVLVAAVAGVLALRMAWQEVHDIRKAHREQRQQEAREQAERLSAERAGNREVLATLGRYNEAADQQIRELTGRVAQLRSELSTLQGDNAALKVDLAERTRRIDDLTKTLGEREAELHELREDSEEAEVLAMPRHAVTTSTDWDALPSAEDLWSAGNHPTVVDLQKLAFPQVEQQGKKQA